MTILDNRQNRIFLIFVDSMEKHSDRYCQSCGMPTNIPLDKIFGTNADQTNNHDYCFYCLENGKYTVDYTMQQMIDVWVKYTDQYNQYASTNYTPKELDSILSARMPNLKRWKQKEQTENVHFEIINKVLVYINQHLFEALEGEQLAEIAGMSFYHFRRVFKSIKGENIGNYIQRLRLEYIAYQLISTDLPSTEIIRDSAVYTKSSLSKAFKKRFGMSPSEYRKELKNWVVDTLKDYQTEIIPEIKKISELHILCAEVGTAYTTIEKYKALWDQLIDFAKENDLANSNNKYVSLSMDEPLVTKTEHRRFYLGITAKESVKPSGIFGKIPLEGGLYAIFRHKGEYVLLPDVYRSIYLNWLPKSGYRQSQPLTFEVYINTPREVPPTDLLTDIYIPIEKIKE
ncbi:MAG: GyrI-like domain-containing protein [Dysgonomonas sp.]|nr:GyrI-like domain-containing protein [Dysgonomonas sp.]